MSSSDSSSDSDSLSDSDSSSDSGSIHDHPEAASYDPELEVYELEEAADKTYDKNVGVPLQLWEDAMNETEREVSTCKLLLQSYRAKPDLAFSRAVALYEGLYYAEVLGLCVPMLGSGLKDFQGYLKTARAYLRRQGGAGDGKRLLLLTEKLQMYMEQTETSLAEFRQRRSENQQKVATMKENRNRLIYEQLVLSMKRSTERLDVERAVLEHVTNEYWLDFTSENALEEMKTLVRRRAPPRGAPAPSDDPPAKR